MDKRNRAGVTVLRGSMVIGFSVVLAACGVLPPDPRTTPEPTATSTATLTSTPTATSAPTATLTPSYTDTPVPSPTHTRTPKPRQATAVPVAPPLPSGDPVLSWKGIPIMPEAIAGEEDSDTYSYTVEVTVNDVQIFYDAEMPKIGWESFAVGASEGGNLMLIYEKGGVLTTIAITAQGDVTLVMILQ